MSGRQIIALQRTPEVASLDANDRIRLRVECLAATKHFDCDRIGLDTVATSRQCLFHHMAEEAALAAGGIEVRTVEDKGKLGATSLDGKLMLPRFGRFRLDRHALAWSLATAVFVVVRLHAYPRNLPSAAVSLQYDCVRSMNWRHEHKRRIV